MWYSAIVLFSLQDDVSIYLAGLSLGRCGSSRSVELFMLLNLVQSQLLVESFLRLKQFQLTCLMISGNARYHLLFKFDP